MRFTVDTYWPLLLLLLIPWIWRAQRRTLTDLSPAHLKIAGLVRSAIVVLIALALIQPVIYRAGARISVAYLLDVSGSVSPSAIQSGIQWIQQTNTAGHPDNARFIPFAANAAVFEQLSQLEEVSVADASTPGSIDQSSTNIENAIDGAISAFAPFHLRRLVLITDGNENSGHLMSMLPRLKSEGIRVYTVPLQARTKDDVWIENILTPSAVTAGELFRMEAQVYSQIETPAEVEIKQGSETLGSKKVQLNPGLNRVAFESSIKEESGQALVDAEVRTPNDPFPENNKFHSSIVVQGRPKILYVESRPQSARYFETALSNEGLNVKTVGPSMLPAAVEELDGYAAVVLSDIPRNNLSDVQMRTLATYVRDLGGGLILAGGENNYGEGGYSKTAIEDALPVTFEAKKEKPDSVAMVMVLDKSGSMRGQKIELTKEAAKAPLELLNDRDSFGVVAFDYNSYWPVKFQSARNRDDIRLSISSIVAGGETNIYPALREAYNQLVRSVAQVKYVILLSDGRTLPNDFAGLTKRMAAAKITVSTVAVGSGSDQELLAQIARGSHGRTYYLENPDAVPQIFTEEAEMATGKTLREDSFKPIVRKNVDAFKGIDFNAAPPLLGYVATKPKETSEVLLESDREDPILARWQYGLGKTAAFLSDLKDRWAVDWLGWSGYPKFWSQLVRETMRREDDEFDFSVVKEGDEARISINAIRKDGRFQNSLDAKVRVVRPDQSVAEIPVRQIAPGAYELKYTLDQKGSYLFRATGARNAGASRVIAYSYPDEYHFYPPNIEVLRSISNETKGEFQPRPEDIFRTNGETTSLPTPLWPYLTTVALGLYVVDVLLRRVRLLE